MHIRNASLNDLDEIMKIYQVARAYMAANNNPNQWGTNNPSQETIMADIERGEFFVIEVNNEIGGVFMFTKNPEPTYSTIIGAWPNEEPYVTVHRVASSGKYKNMMTTAIDYAKTISNNIRIDTHDDNHIMQKLILANAFHYCGTIYVSDGSPRRAYHLCVKDRQ